MSEATFIRLLGEIDKGAGLARAMRALRKGETPEGLIYRVDPEEFRDIPGTPFAYWVSEEIRRLFQELPPFEDDGRFVRQGLATADDFRFVRTWWEVPADRVLDAANGPGWREDIDAFQSWCRQRTNEGKCWAPFAKGGEYSPFYGDVHLVVNWEQEGEEIRNLVHPKTGRLASRPQSTDCYFRPGLTWPRRTTSGFSVRAMPAGCVFADKGPAALLPVADLFRALAVLLSPTMQVAIEARLAAAEETRSGTAAPSYEVGLVQTLPWPTLPRDVADRTETRMRDVVGGIRARAARSEVVWESRLPLPDQGVASLRDWTLGEQRVIETNALECLVRIAESEADIAVAFGGSEASGPAVGASAALKRSEQHVPEQLLSYYQKPVHELIRWALKERGGQREVAVKSYFVSRLLEVLSAVFDVSPRAVVDEAARAGVVPYQADLDSARHVFGVMIGLAFGRWDVRMVRDPSLMPALSDPYDPLRISPPGMLVDPEGLPARREAIVSEELLRERATASRLPRTRGSFHTSNSEERYPLEIPWDGVLVDDPGLEGEGAPQTDLVRRCQAALTCVYGERASEIDAELSELLGARDIRDYLRRGSGYFSDHLSLYSRSRRKAPIYWPLSTESSSFTIWIYYPRLTADTLYLAVTEHVDPTLTRTEQRLARIERGERGATGRETAQLAKQASELVALRDELRDLRGELLRIAELPYRPNLDDGVQLTAAPLWRLFRHKPWRKALEETWKGLEKGDYDWAHLSYELWPERVRDKCRKDRSLAIAHGLEELFESADDESSKRRVGSRRR